MTASRPVFLLLLLVAIVAAACGSDDREPVGVGSGLVEPTASESPTATAITARPSGTPTSSAPGAEPTSTASPFDGIETHPLTRIYGTMPSRPDIQATAAPGGNFQFERKPDSFPADGPRPFLYINWNAPLPVATSEQQALIQLLARVPDSPENRQDLTLNNQAAWRDHIGMEQVTFEDGADAFVESLLEAFNLGYASRPDNMRYQPPTPGEGSPASGFANQMAQTSTFDAIGFDGRNMDQAIVVASRVAAFTEVIAGRYSPELSKRLLAECECPQPDAITVYGGYEYWSWGDGPEGELSRRNSAPVFDGFGRGGHVLITETGLYRTLERSLMEQLIDTLNGTMPSLADSPDHLFIADVMSANNANDIKVRSGDLLTRDKILPDRTGTYSSGGGYTESFESNLANALMAPLMSPFDLIATGAGWDGSESYAVVILVHDTEEAAIANAERLGDRLVNSNAQDGLPWATKFSQIDISVSNNRVVAVFKGGNPYFLLFNTYAEILFAHEPG